MIDRRKKGETEMDRQKGYRVGGSERDNIITTIQDALALLELLVLEMHNACSHTEKNMAEKSVDIITGTRENSTDSVKTL